MKTAVVVTSISGPNEILQSIAKGCGRAGWDFYVAGDRKSPGNFHLEGCRFLDVASQKAVPFRYAELCPENSYVRKNLGFLQAISEGAELIVETDDDNLPLEDFWRERGRAVDADVAAGAGWTNVYALFSEGFVYPRGFPLPLVRQPAGPVVQGGAICPIQQGLVDEAPDVDAIYRLIQGEAPPFIPRRPVVLGENVWCPFNSQNTAFFREVFPLLYLPAFCTFRATDIWRGFVAQRVLWSCGWNLSFHQADVRQIRNPHNLLSDFELEVPVYLQTQRMVEALESLPLARGAVGENLLRCYELLASIGVVGEREPEFVDAWLSDLEAAGWKSTVA